MRKIYFLLFSVFSFIATTQSLFSQTVTIGTGTSVQRQPLAYYYGHARSSMIYTATEMGTTGGAASVISVAFECNTAMNTGPTIIYLREVGSTTTQTSTTWAAKIASATEVYNGTPAIGAVGWRTISLTAPFPLNANQNLEVLVETNFGGTGNGLSTGNDIRYSTVTSGHQFWQDDNSPPIIAGTVNGQRPNIQMVLGGPILCVAPPGGGTIQGPAGAACSGLPFNLSVTGASFGSGLTYQWESSPDGSTWTPIPSATAATLSISQGANTHYRRKITCSGQDGFSTSLLVTTTAPVSAFPWTESFDAATIPSCWSNQYVSGTSNWTYVTANGNGSITPRSGARMAQFLVGAYGPSTKLVTPRLNLTSLTSPRLRFYYANVNWFGDIDELRVFYKSSYGGAWTQIGVDYVTEHTTWTEVTLALPNPSDDYYIAFEATSNWARGLDLDDVTVEETPPCAAPTGLSASGFTPTTVDISWLAAITPPAGGYEWEVRTSGAGGSGAAGLAASGTTLPAVLTANATGLLANTAYTLYVRTVCTAGTLYSAWSDAFNFRTPCDPFITFPYTETFEAASPTRSCWWPTQVSGAFNWTYGAGAGNGGAITSAHGGTVNARHFGNGSGSVARLVSPALDFSSMSPAFGAQITFWYANENWLGDQNELRVYYKTSAAGTWTLIPGAIYTSNTAAWTEVELMLPSSTSSEYYIAFEGTELFGFGVAIDDVRIEAAPSCPKPKNFGVLSTTPTTAIASFTSPGNSFIIEYGAPGFTPGTGATAGVGGTIVTGTASPINITGLTGGTTYDFYVRRECDPGVDYSLNVMITASSLCDAVSIPYFQDFETSTPPLGFPSCTSMEDVNGNSGPLPNVGGGGWTTFAGTSGDTYVSPTRVVRYLYDFADPSRGADDWFYIQGLNLTAGTSYRLKFFYKGSNGPDWIESLEVKYGTAAHSSAMANTIYTNNNIATALADPWDSARVDFTPAASGVYYIGFHATSLPDQAFLYLDDISVDIAPVVDAGATGITGVPTCPAPTGVISATVINYNLTTLDFAAYPVTVTADITGAAATTLTTVLNSGTLAAGASMDVAFPAYNYTSGFYNVTIAATSPDDPITGNNSFVTSFFVNESPAVAAITPAVPAVCVGQSVQLSTQFPSTPPAPVTLPAVTSGAISVAVPDNSVAGITHTLAVSGVPSGASVTGISITLNVEHTWVNDLVVNLRAPNGKVLNLFNRKGGFFEADINTVISSSATASIPATGAPFTGTYAPDAGSGVGPTGYISNASSFSDLFGAGNGDWILSLRDHAEFDEGTLTSWSITITYGTPNPRVKWAPLTGLFTNSAGTLGYFGENALSVYAKPATSTTYTVTTTNPLTGCESTKEVLVTVNENPVVAITALPSNICLSDTLVALSATPAGGNWSGRGVSGSAFLPPLTTLGTHPVSYTYTDNLGCTTVATANATVEACPERMILLRDEAVLVYPNPSDGRFNIQVKSTLYNKLTMRVYTSSGSLVRTQQFTGLVYNRRIFVDLTTLPGGTYMVHLSYDGGVRTSEKTYPVIIGR